MKGVNTQMTILSSNDKNNPLNISTFGAKESPTTSMARLEIGNSNVLKPKTTMYVLKLGALGKMPK